jgi:hypothetical protein
MRGGIFAATATARRCHPDQFPESGGGSRLGWAAAATQDRWRRRSCRLPMGESAAAGACDVGARCPAGHQAERARDAARSGAAPAAGAAARRGRGRGLVLACPPAGYGKTVLLVEWVRRGRRPVAWLSLDAADNDPARFWRHTVAALDRVRPGISERMGPLLGPPAPPSFEPLMTALINEVAGQPDADEALLLVLDDYHVISSQPVHESLGFLLEHRPPGLQLARPAAVTRRWPWRGCGPADS